MSKSAEVDYVKNVGGMDNPWLNRKPFGGDGRETSRLLRDLGRIIELLNLPPGASLLDVGCGPGWTSVMLARHGWRVHGVDISPDMIAIAQRRRDRERLSADCEFSVADVEAFDLGRTFDAVLIYDALHHVQNEQAVLAHCRRHLKPGGQVLLAEPGTHHAVKARDVSDQLGVTERGFSIRHLTRALRHAGFTAIRHHVPVQGTFMAGPVSAIRHALYDLANYFLAKDRFQVWLSACAPGPA